MLMGVLAAFLLLISNCIALWSESVECVVFVDTAFVAQDMGGFFFGCQGPVLSSSQLCSFLTPPRGSIPDQLFTPKGTSWPSLYLGLL